MSAWGLAFAVACTRLCARRGPKPGQAASARPCLVRALPLDDETVLRHAGPLTASFHPAARACQHGDWHLLLPVPTLQAPRTRTGSGSKCQTLPSARFTRSMMKQCGGTLVRSRRPFTRPPAHVSMGTGTCCCLSRLCRRRGPRPGQAASARPCLVRASPLDDETVRRHAGPLTASFHPAARACQHGDWHLLPVAVFARAAVPNRVRQQVPDPAWCALHRSMTKQCGGTLVRSRRPFTRPPAHVSMGTGTCCCLSRLCRRRGPEPGQAASARPCLVRASPLDDETVRRHAGPRTASVHPAARACQHGDWHLLLPVPSLQAPRTRTGSGSKCQTLPSARFTRSMMKQCGGTLVRSRRPFTRPPAHVSMGTGTCCLYPSLRTLRSRTGSGSCKCQTLPGARFTAR